MSIKGSSFERFTPILLVAVILLAFAVGVLWQKVQLIEKGGSGTTQTGTGNTAGDTVSPLSVDNIKKYAKELGLDEKEFSSCLDDGEFAQKVADDVAYGTSVGISGTPGFFINGIFLGGAFPYEIFKEIIDKELSGGASTDFKDYSTTLQEAYSEADPTRRMFNPVPKDVEVGDSPVLGESNAKVTIIEFSDFECPYCDRHYTQTFQSIKKGYIDTGKVRYVHKQFPLSFHPNAQKSAEASECAKAQGKFWEMHDKLFEANVSS